jgi:hypothetical protein
VAGNQRGDVTMRGRHGGFLLGEGGGGEALDSMEWTALDTDEEARR